MRAIRVAEQPVQCRPDTTGTFRPHIRSLRRVQLDVEEERLRPDTAARLTLYGLPVVLGAIVWWQQWQLVDPGTIGAGCALMAGNLFTAFTQLASLRDSLEDRHEAVGDYTAPIQRTAAHLLVGALASASESVAMIVASGMRDHPDGKTSVISTCIVLPIAVYFFLLFIMAIKKMYAAYLRVFESGRYLRATRKGSSR